MLAFLLLATVLPLQAQTDSSALTLDRIFASDEFQPEYLGGPRWLQNQPAYVKLEPDSAAKGRALVRYDAATGKRDVWVPAARLVPAGDSLPLPVEDYAVSADGKHAAAVHQLAEGLAAEHARRLLGARSRDRKLQKLGGANGEAVDADVRQVLARRRTRRLRARAQPLRRATRRRRDHAAHDATGRARSSTGRSTGSTRKSSACATASAGAPTASASRTGSSTPRACGTST